MNTIKDSDQTGAESGGYTLFEVTGDRERVARAQDFITRGLEAGKLKPIIAKTFPFRPGCGRAPPYGIEPATRQARRHGVPVAAGP